MRRQGPDQSVSKVVRRKLARLWEGDVDDGGVDVQRRAMLRNSSCCDGVFSPQRHCSDVLRAQGRHLA